MRPIISIVGKSNSGKTTLLEGLIVELKQRGYEVGVIKHTGEDFELDKVGKDSWRLNQAGSSVVAVSSPHKVAVIRQVDRDLSPQELSRFIGRDYDLILTEGFKQSNATRVEVHRKEQGVELLFPPEQLLAVVTNEPLVVDVPQFATNEISGLADFIEKKLLAHRKGDDVELYISENFVPLNLFVKDLLVRTLVAMVSSLKGVNRVKSLYISLRKKT
ncbi:molybdopterin-guanine dinucleotide biosynthesis protein B [Chloroflexota bacterium]